MASFVRRGVKIHTNFKLLFKGYAAITLFGHIFCRANKKEVETWIDDYRGQVMVNHEIFHIAQGRDMGWFKFYCAYLGYWIRNIFKYGPSKAYKNIPFEREAYANQHLLKYWSDVGGEHALNETHWKEYRD